jgi:hypothetical protein
MAVIMVPPIVTGGGGDHTQPSHICPPPICHYLFYSHSSSV